MPEGKTTGQRQGGRRRRAEQEIGFERTEVLDAQGGRPGNRAAAGRSVDTYHKDAAGTDEKGIAK